ncbi:membrane protein FAM174A-like [Saccostrea echinata]|uniref:membrane protein FAM174A-like n=1 Tax=Saccostrea echinata TaxID=191078 RepID=UPI002A7FE5BB|nr:membrane protein FAM174A-like [Saccostrea echinata]
MTSKFVYICFLVVILTILSCDSEDHEGTASSNNTTLSTTTPKLNTNDTAKNGTEEMGGGKGILDFGENKGMFMRAFYVLIGITAIVVVYFGVRAWRVRRKRNKSKKYGLITGRGADYEMAPLDADDDDDDEDTTVFEMNRRKK